MGGPMSSRSNDREAGAPSAQERSERVIVGRVRRAHGLHGDVAVEVHSDVEERFAVGARLWLARPGVEAESVQIEHRRPFKGGWLIRFAGFGDRDVAEAARGAWLEVDRRDVPPAEEGTWYHFEIIGCRCVEPSYGDLGIVRDLIEDGGGLLMRLESDGGREILVPFVRAFLRHVDVEGRRIEVTLPQGLVETCTSPR